jgi:hypothetical protein
MDFRSIRYIIEQGLPKFGSNWLSSFKVNNKRLRNFKMATIAMEIIFEFTA